MEVNLEDLLSFWLIFIAELPRAKRASGAPWVRKIGKPSSREKLVMTSPYERRAGLIFIERAKHVPCGIVTQRRMRFL